MLLLAILLASLAYTPGLAQSSANAYAGSTGGGAYANAIAYAFFYPSNNNGNTRDCTYDRCTPTCSLPSPQNCPTNSNPCNCPPGTIISEQGGQCVQEQQCSRYANCKGDYNATYTDCPISCPSTCARPNAEYCRNTRCGAPGCECNDGYILSSENGKCIKVEDCPGGNVCGKNETFLGCIVECPSLYCQVDQSRVACGPVQPPCPSGCTCKPNYLRRSTADHTCILESDCPPGKCYGDNEEWNWSVPICFSDTCKDKKQITKDCPFSPNERYPRCLCKKDFYRNKNGCVPVEQCPPDNQ